MKSDSALTDYWLGIDASTTMNKKDPPGEITRWDHAREVAKSIVSRCENKDSKGIDLVVFSDRLKHYEGVTSAKVEEILQEWTPNGTTDTAGSIQMITQKYFDRKSKGPVNAISVLILSDGLPSMEEDVVQTIKEVCEKMDTEKEINISFIQVGTDEAGRDYLKKLKSDLSGAKYDIVQVTTFDVLSQTTIEDLVPEAVIED
jgi:hypothetical protein